MGYVLFNENVCVTNGELTIVRLRQQSGMLILSGYCFTRKRLVGLHSPAGST